MSSKSPAFANDILALVFQGAALPKAYGDAVFVSLHTAAPSDQGDREATYPGYRRARADRSDAAWKPVPGPAARMANADPIVFPLQAGEGRQEITHFGIGLKATGAGRLLYSAALTAPLLVARNIEPRFNPGDLAITEG